jgi:SAM-dependent methyltransferase
VEFIVADALALPFPKSLFSTVSSVNILEKVPDPLQHLAEANRVLNEKDSMFLFSDPFSWDETVMDSELWLGGKANGKYGGRGMGNISRILSDGDGVFDPPMEIIDRKDIAWKIRKTANLWEYINSQSVVATR